MNNELLIEYINERIEFNSSQLDYFRKNKISMNSCGAGFCQGAIEELMDIKKFILGEE